MNSCPNTLKLLRPPTSVMFAVWIGRDSVEDPVGDAALQSRLLMLMARGRQQTGRRGSFVDS